MFVAFINKHPKIYSLKIDTWIWEEIEFNDGLYDFKWVTAPINGEYPMKAIILENNLITLKGRTFHINGADNTITYEDKQEKSFIKILSNSISYFKLDNENFYFMTYDSADNFISGFYNEKDIDYNNIKNIEPTINTISPLEFFNEVDIIYLKFIRNTKYAFYKIRDKKDDIIYHGIIDILLNKVIFNTNEEILEFKPYSSNSMLAKTSNSAYKICTIQDNGNCIDQCSNSFTIFDVSKPNQCGNEINCKNYILIPNEICIESCDENIYTKIDNKCGLCRDMDENKPYKLLNSIGCVDINEANTMLVNSKLNFLSCKENYKLNNGKCIPICYELCDTCEEYSDNIKDQKCTSCKNDYYLQEGNCVNECSEGYFIKEKKCEKCSEFCKKCENSEKCNICYDGYYLEENVCKKCSTNCKTCSKGPEENGNNNCLACDQNTINKYLINDINNHNCVENCPENTFLDDSSKTCEKCSEFCKICENSEKCNICYDGYYLEGNVCKKCSTNCKTCSKGPDENGNNNCLTCDQNTLNKYLINDVNNHNCVENCPENTFLDDSSKTCEKCSEFCKICENSEKCSICYDGYYLEENVCKKCSTNCKTCSKGPEENGNNNCLTCDLNSLYKYLIDNEKNYTCVDNCPINSILIESNMTCIIKNEVKSDNNGSTKHYIIWIIIILILILLLIIAIYICRKCCKRVTSNEIEQINDIEQKEIIK